MADNDILIRLLVEAAQAVQELGNTEAAVERVAKAAERIQESRGSDALERLNDQLRSGTGAASDADDAFDGFGISIGRLGGLATIATTAITGAFAISQRLRDVVAGNGEASDEWADRLGLVNEQLRIIGGFDIGFLEDLQGWLRRNAEAARGFDAAIDEAQEALRRKKEIVEELTRRYSDNREEILLYAQALEQARTEVDGNEEATQRLAQRTKEWAETLDTPLEQLPQIVQDTVALVKAEDELTDVQKHHAQVAQEAADAQRELAETTEELTEKAENLQAYAEAVQQLADTSVAELDRIKQAFEDAFRLPEQRESDAFREQQESLAELREELERLEGLDFRTPEELNRTLELQTQIADLERQRVEQFEDTAEASENAARRQAEALLQIQEFTDGARQQVSDLADQYGDLDASSRRTLELIIANYERELELTGDLEGATERFREEFASALDTAREKAETAFGSYEEGARKAREEQEKLQKETEGLGDETEKAAASAGELNIKLGESITKYGGVNAEAARHRDLTAESLDLATQLAATL